MVVPWEQLLLAEQGNVYLLAVNERLNHLTYHMHECYWLDFRHLNEIYCYKGKEFGAKAVNKFNIYADSIPNWLSEWLPRTGWYLA